MNRKGFTLIELMIVIAIIAIIAAIAIPGLLRARMSANERSASASLRSVSNGEEVVSNTDADRNGERDYWTGDLAGLYFLSVDPLAAGDNIKVVQDMGLALADLEPITAAGVVDLSFHNGMPAGYADGEAKSGYWYGSLPNVAANDHDQDYGFSAVPARMGRTGERAFIVNSDGSIYARVYEDAGGIDPVEGTSTVAAAIDTPLLGGTGDYPDDDTLVTDWETVN